MPTRTRRSPSITIIGSGFGGIGMAIVLRRAGFGDITILEKADDVGGVWRDNTYPGAACDVPSHLYSFSFAPKTDWTRRFAPQPEIHDYLRETADRFGVLPLIRFGSEVSGASFDAASGTWTVRLADGGEHVTDVLISAVGQLSRPAVPALPGLDSFTGAVFHSATWDHDYDLTGKRVGVIGTGASAIQLVPELAKVAGHLDVYQRTAPWIVPRTERAYTGVEHWAHKNVPGFQTAIRGAIYAMNELTAFGLTYAPKALKPVELVCRANIARSIRDPELRRKATPTFQVGCKRILRSNDWYPAIARPNVDLITDGIDHITPTGVVTKDGTARDIDVLVVATGFHVTDSPVFDTIVGASGQSLAQVWDKIGMQGYKGSFVSDFPNMMLMVGPSTGLGHTSMVYMIESQLNYLVDYVKTVRAQGIVRTDVKADAQRDYNRGIQHALRNSVWVNGGCASWYADANGNITTLWPGFTFNFRRTTRSFDVAAYDVVRGPRPVRTGTPDDAAASAPAAVNA